MIERFRKVEGMKVEGMESPDDRKVEHFCCCHSLLFSIEKYCRRRSAICRFFNVQLFELFRCCW
jgi:hypothetical protein